MESVFEYIQANNITLCQAKSITEIYNDIKYLEGNDNFKSYFGFGKNIDLTESKKERYKNNFIKVICSRLIEKLVNFNEVLGFKDYLMNNNVQLNSKIYNEMIYRTVTFEQALKLKEEMEMLGLCPDGRSFIILIQKSDSFDDAMNIYKHINDIHLDIDIRIYYVMLKKSTNDGQVEFLLAEIESKKIIIDDLFFSVLQKMYGSSMFVAEERNKREKYLLAVKIYNSIEESHFDLANTKLDIEVCNYLLCLSQDIKTIIYISDLMYLNLIKPNESTLYYLVNQVKLSKTIDEYTDVVKIIKNLSNQISEEQKLKIYKNIFENSKYTGLYGAYTIKCLELVDNIKKQRKSIKNIEEIFFLNGMIEAYEAESLDFQHRILFSEEEIKRLNQNDDDELYKYDMVFQKGQIDGLRNKEKVYSELLMEIIPLRLICFIDNEQLVDNFRLFASKNGFYEADINNINELKINTFFCTASLKEFELLFSKMDFNNVSTVVKIISKYDSRQFIEVYEKEEFVNYIYEIYGTKLSYLSFLKIKDYENVTKIYESILNNKNVLKQKN